MSSDRLGRWWLILTGCLVLLLLAFGLFFLLKSNPGSEISLQSPAPAQDSGQILIDGAVAQPGIYPLKADDTLSSLLAAAGGMTLPNDSEELHLFVAAGQPEPTPQKIDINRADLWLLEALPQIGSAKAQAIVDYRQQNGNFRNIQEISLVPGISASIFEKIEGLITVSQ